MRECSVRQILGGAPRRRLARFSAFALVAVLAGLVWAAAASAEPIIEPIRANLLPVVGAPDLLRDPQSYTVGQIIRAGGIIIGDKLFDSFGVLTTKSQDATAPGADEILITPIKVLKPGALLGGDFGFMVNGGWSAPAGQLSDSTIEFRAAILPEYIAQGFAFHDNALWMTGFGVADSMNAGAVSVSENIFVAHPSSSVSPFANTFVHYRSDTDNQLADAATFAPVTQMWIVKDVVAYGGTGATGVAHISEFYQTFSQCPEPGTLVLLGVAGLGLAVHRWRNRR